MLIHGEDQQRGLVHLFGAGRVLDQLEHAVAKHHLAGRGGDVTAQLKGAVIRQFDDQLAVVGLQISDQVFQPLHKTLAFCLYRALQNIGVGGKEIGRRHHRDDLLAEIDQPLLLGRFHVLGVFDRLAQRFGVDQILLLDEVEIGMGLPQRIGKTFVGGRLPSTGASPPLASACCASTKWATDLVQ